MQKWAWLPPAALDGLRGSVGKGRTELAGGLRAAGGGPAREVGMRRVWMVAAVGVAVLVLGGAAAQGQTTSKITVTGGEANSGVVIVHVQWQGQAYDLQCNQNMSGCKSLKKGDYTMVELPKNFGAYDCRDVEVYPESPQPPKDTKIGEYCLLRP